MTGEVGPVRPPGGELVARPPQSPDDRRRRVLVIAAGAVAAVAVGATAWAVVAGGGDVAATASPTATTSVTAGPTATAGPDASGAPVPDPTTPAPGEPGGGATDDPDPEQGFDPTTEDAVGLDATATFDSGVTARLEAVEAVEGEAQGPGEVAGPAVRVTVAVTNGTDEPLDLGTSVVNVYGGADRVPGEPLSGPGVDVLAGSLAPGETVTGTYVFGLDADLRDPLQVTVSHDPTVTTVLFEGTGPGA